MQTIKNYTHITQDFRLYLKKKKKETIEKPHIEQKKITIYIIIKANFQHFLKNLQL